MGGANGQLPAAVVNRLKGSAGGRALASEFGPLGPAQRNLAFDVPGMSWGIQWPVAHEWN